MRSFSLSRSQTHSSSEWLLSRTAGVACIRIVCFVLVCLLCPIGSTAGMGRKLHLPPKMIGSFLQLLQPSGSVAKPIVPRLSI